MPHSASTMPRSTPYFCSTASSTPAHCVALAAPAAMRDGEAIESTYCPTGLPYSGSRRVAAITRASGVKPPSAWSKVARVMPRFCASAHKASRKAVTRGPLATASAIGSARARAAATRV